MAGIGMAGADEYTGYHPRVAAYAAVKLPEEYLAAWKRAIDMAVLDICNRPSAAGPALKVLDG